MKQRLTLFIVILGLFLPFYFVEAGIVFSSSKYAWSNNVGYINFENVIVSDNALSGYAWSTNDGWINFSPTNGGVNNDGNGHLSGSAWGEQLGWIDFSNVSINTSTGRFSGTATGTLVGTITFDCPNYCDVETDWRPPVVPINPVTGGGKGGNFLSGVTTSVPASKSVSRLVTITLPIPKNLQNVKNLGVYWFNEINEQWVLIPDAKFSSKEVIFQFNPSFKFNIFASQNIKLKTSKKMVLSQSIPVSGEKPAINQINNQPVQLNIATSTQHQKSFIERVINFLGSIFDKIVKIL